VATPVATLLGLALKDGCVLSLSRVDRMGDQTLALKPIDLEYAIRAVYKTVNDSIVVVRFYPVKRERFNV